MAKAKMIPPVPTEPVINLELTRDEAMALLAVCAKISGPVTGLRGVFSAGHNSIGDALGELLGTTDVNALHTLVEAGKMDNGSTKVGIRFL